MQMHSLLSSVFSNKNVKQILIICLSNFKMLEGENRMEGKGERW